jgi:16S rRNA (uracil1498-N3)-methyltransferase
MQQFLTPNIDPASESYIFSEVESKHVAKVLRKNVGDILNLTNGKGQLITAKLSLVSPKSCVVKLLEIKNIPVPKTAIHMVVAPTKNTSRFEWFLEKATELGVYKITPVLCDKSERKHIKHERCEKIIHAAVKQSLRAYVPILAPLTPLKDLEIKTPAFMAHCEDSPKKSLKDVVNGQIKCTILIGPEGDFSKSEIAWANDQNITAVHLGNNRLRTETAALAALHTALLMNQ